MAQAELTAILETPAARVGLVLLALGLILVLLREVRRIPARLLVLMATAFLDMVGLLIVVPLLPFYVQRLGADGVVAFGMSFGIGALAGIVVAAYTLAQLASAPLWGRFSDRHGRRPALLIALGASAVAYVVFGLADSIWLLLLSRIVQGAGGGTVGVIQAYVADTTAPEQRARALGWLSAATNLGVALGPVLGVLAVRCGEVDLLPGAMTLRLGTAAPGVFAAVLCLASMGFALRYLQESRPMSAAPEGEQRTPPRQAAWRVLAHPGQPASRLIWIYAVAMGAFQGVNAVLALFLAATYQVDEGTIGYFFTYIGAISVFARVLLLGRLVDRLGEVRLARLGVVLLAAGLSGIAAAGSLPTLFLAIGLVPLGTAFTFPCVTALLSRVIAPADRGLYLGLQQTFGGVARIAAPLFYGFAFDRLGAAVPFHASTVLVLATLLFGIGLDQNVRRAPST